MKEVDGNADILFPTLTVLGLLPHDALEHDAGARFAGPEAVGVRHDGHVRSVRRRVLHLHQGGSGALLEIYKRIY